MKRTQTQETQAAFTLVELMVTLTLLAILLAMAAPGFREFNRNNRVSATHNDLLTAFRLAHNEALKRSTAVTVCASSDSETCTGDTDWTEGWIVFEDGSGITGEVSPPEDEVLQIWPATHQDVTLEATKAFIRYSPNGSILPDGPKTFDVYVDGCTGPHARRLSVSAIGSLTATKQACPS